MIRAKRGRVVFIDYSQSRRDGSNPRKLYYTEADYVKSLKIKDVALGKKFPQTYSSDASDTFWAATNASGIVFLGNHGAPGEPACLVAYDPGQEKLLWNRSGNVLSMGMLLHKGRLWSGITDRNSIAHAVAYSPDDGNLLVKLPLDSPGSGVPVGVGKRVLIRTRSSIYSFAPAPLAMVGSTVSTAPPTVGAGATPAPTKAKPGWRLYRDRTAGYLIQTPTSWRFDRKKLVKMGGLRMSIPFVKTGVEGGRAVFLGSVHVLTWEAAGRDANALWKSVWAQRRRSNPNVRAVKVHRVDNVGGSSAPGIKAIYSYRNAQGYPVQLRSLCVVSNGVAFELRGWSGPTNPQAIWQEIEGIFGSFRPHRFR
jgi:hypothetical protein